MDWLLCKLGLHRWATIYEYGPRIVQGCERAGCTAKRSTMYDMAHGGTYWVSGDWWTLGTFRKGRC